MSKILDRFGQKFFLFQLSILFRIKIWVDFELSNKRYVFLISFVPKLTLENVIFGINWECALNEPIGKTWIKNWRIPNREYKIRFDLPIWLLNCKTKVHITRLCSTANTKRTCRDITIKLVKLAATLTQAKEHWLLQFASTL